MKSKLVVFLILLAQQCYANTFAYPSTGDMGKYNSDRLPYPINSRNPAITDTSTKYQNRMQFYVSGAAIITSKDRVPFWMRANQYGSNPVTGASTAIVARARRNYHSNTDRLVDWGFAAEGRFNVGKKTEAILIQGYLKGRLGIFQLKAGRSREIMGLVDSTLSSGSFSISGNTLGIPKLELSIPEFWNIPFLGGLIAVKGNFAHGWVGKKQVDYNTGDSVVATYLHQKSFYARVGKRAWRLNFFGGFNHQAFWGNERKMNPNMFRLSTLETLSYVVFGKAYGEKGTGLPLSKVGNHIGSIDQQVQYEFDKLTVNGYHQFFYEVGGLYHLNNVKDGLWGITFTNRQFSTSSAKVRLNKIVLEFMNSKSQGGELDAKITPSGDEDYYNNYLYPSGWTYNGENLGNPLLTSKRYARKNLPARDEYIVNNRVEALHLGLEGAVSNVNIVAKFTMSQNYGTYGTSPLGHSLNTIRSPGKPPYFGKEAQFSGFLQASKDFKSINLSIGTAFDRGTMIYDSAGFWATISKSW